MSFRIPLTWSTPVSGQYPSNLALEPPCILLPEMLLKRQETNQDKRKGTGKPKLEGRTSPGSHTFMTDLAECLQACG